jgi:hypothetical protein
VKAFPELSTEIRLGSRRFGDMASQPNRDAKESGALVTGAPLEPIRVVERELTRPDGTKVKVQVPVYPPFQLGTATAPQEPPAARRPTRTPKARKRERRRGSG